ncbi:hypothetical protein GLOTRDRAFT_133155 [Gloeophyllum trabeum ATCC 11539]|uniref:Uncharacterized protein n=1 Tax=Gloeophyllum trabeum (strain ATCC 11539 / FP-39264 / Madison 617) TaxID=670483 RepID=S7RFI5_GLOTA|nr:uncharacterized protein GLOTRDRAFT_133155 [Gloeophyllum trabeum ATCC 11539]EPQ51279.1 hypothetical protein GLOTRDRAFT_133155 [Gloeophyllum trabeum ATCC 11539]
MLRNDLSSHLQWVLFPGACAALVAQTKKAGGETDNEERAEGETESMLKLAGHLFAHCRRFLAVVAHSGSDQSLLSEGDESEDRGKPASTTIGIV